MAQARNVSPQNRSSIQDHEDASVHAEQQGQKMHLGPATWSTHLTPPPGVHGEGEPEPMSLPVALARTAIPPAVAVGLVTVVTLGLEAARPSLALRAARFTNLALASLLAGNGVGSVLFVHPALATLKEDESFRSEQQLAHRYPEIMRVLMPATVASGLSVLWLLRDRQDTAFQLTLVGTAGLLGVLGTTALEVPLNKQTLKTPPDAPPADWSEIRAEWTRFNQLRTLCEVVSWGCFCLAALVQVTDSNRGGGR